jgi:hypothetical protein
MKNLKQFIKNHNRILELKELFKYADSQEAVALRFTKLNKFKYSTHNDSLQIKLDDLNYCDIDDAILNLGITNQETIKKIKENINENYSYEHANDYILNDIFDRFSKNDSFNKRFFYKEYCYKQKKDIYEERFEFKDWGYNSTSINSKLFNLENIFYSDSFDFAREISELTKINNYRDLIHNVRLYKNHINSLRYYSCNILELQQEFLKESYTTIKEFVYNLRAMLQQINYYNEVATTEAQSLLENDIESFLENEGLLKDGDIEKMKFDYIAKIEGEEIITNKGAKAPLEDCKKALEVFKNGGNLEGLKLGVYKINKIFNIKNNVFFRAGCHLIKIDDNLINQLA